MDRTIAWRMKFKRNQERKMRMKISEAKQQKSCFLARNNGFRSFVISELKKEKMLTTRKMSLLLLYHRLILRSKRF